MSTGSSDHHARSAATERPKQPERSEPTVEKPAAPAAGSAKRGRFGPWSAVSVTLLAFFGSQLLAGLFIGLYIALSRQDSKQAIDALTGSTFSQFLFILIVEIITLAILLMFMRRRSISLSEIGLGRGPQAKDVGYGAVYFIAYFIVLAIVLALVGKLIPSLNLDQEQQLGFDTAAGAGPLALVFISLVILPPLVEEIMIRGFLYSGLRRKLNKVIAALIASVIFGIAHLQLGSGAPPLYVAAIDTFVLSLFLIGLRERTGSLWSGIMVHGVKNGLAFVTIFVLHIS